MVNGIRSAKSGTKWTDNDLDAYNIKITFQDAQTFFGETPLPAPSVDSDVLAALTADDAVSDDAYNLLSQLDLAMTPSSSEPAEEDSAVVNFAVALFRSLGYIHRPRAIRTRKSLRVLVCGDHKSVRTDLCIVDRDNNDIILVVHEDKGDIDPHAQLVVEAIAAFQNNNARRRADGLEPRDSQVIPGILMHGTSPSFFKIPLTLELIRCVERGQPPPAGTPTIVAGHVPEIPRPHRRFSEGMRPLDNRQAFLECYEGFKRFVV
ncbi:hypothetical protein NLJ89_g3891 [Agrocybe chaxingu]|uniref:Uncharacterized protein n=1 Tax=Agrocybe chaxingu TaxID=84603 RepID=A0A9W8K4C9_9AGAR|nr:hypothetical protein NLJ89_g3891 [Agrocybe chaxingu]